MRAIGPAGATALWAVSIDKELMGGRLVYVVLELIVVCGVVASRWVDDGPMGEE